MQVFRFTDEQGKRDSIIVVAQLSPSLPPCCRSLERTGRGASWPKSQAELIAEMALNRAERRLYQVEEQVETVAEAVENIKRKYAGRVCRLSPGSRKKRHDRCQVPKPC
jgi:hypothetical protein